MRKAQVFIHNKNAGTLIETDAPIEYIFIYNDDYLANMANQPVCLSMPLTNKEYRSKYLFPYFFNLLSEGENRLIQSTLLHIDAEDDFGILLKTASCDTVGAITVKQL